jgi:hypothetical protein
MKKTTPKKKHNLKAKQNKQTEEKENKTIKNSNNYKDKDNTTITTKKTTTNMIKNNLNKNKTTIFRNINLNDERFLTLIEKQDGTTIFLIDP